MCIFKIIKLVLKVFYYISFHLDNLMIILIKEVLEIQTVKYKERNHCTV